MAKIDTTLPTIKAIYQHYEDTREDWRRDHFGASMAGKPCDRALWYSFHWAMAPEFPGRILRLFDTGNKEEQRLVDDLRGIGVEVYDRDPQNLDEQIRYTDPTCGGHLAGSLDGIGRGFAEAPKSWHVLEFKTSNAAGFAKMQKKGVMETKPEHFSQIQLYLRWSGLTRAFYFMVCKDTDEIYSERIRYDPEYAAALVERAHKLIYMPNPPDGISMHGDAWDCKYCDYAPLCKREALPEINCRTCAHSEPFKAGGQWSCLRHAHFVDADTMREGCPDHIYLPSLVPVDVADADPERGTITYADGVCNGPDGVSSCEMRKKYEH